MSLATVIIHKGNTDYLPYSLAQVKESNPQSKIYLLGDDSNKHYSFIEHDYINKYANGTKDFANIYKHLSSNDLEFELFCFQRWIILKNFMFAKKLNNCFCIDSDVMVYTNISKEQTKFQSFDIAFSYVPLNDSPSPHCIFINNVEALKNFCDFLTALYTDSSLLKLMELQLQQRAQNNLPGGACDMTAFREFAKGGYSKIGYTSSIDNDSTYDHNINCSEGVFEMSNGIKNIYFVNNYPYCKNYLLNKEIMFNILHFQGSAKKYMKYYFTGKEIELNNFWHYYTILQSKIKFKLKKYSSNWILRRRDA